MSYKKSKIFFLLFLIILNGNIIAKCYQDNNASACPNSIFLLEKSTALTSFVDVKITNTGPILASIQLRATYTGGSSLCGSNYTLQPKQSITVNLECIINSYPYTLRDRDGRSNTLTITDDNSCFGKTVGESCQGGIVIKNCDGSGKIISTNYTDTNINIPNTGFINDTVWGGSGITTGVTDPNDGQKNTNKLISSSFQNFFIIPAFFCANYVSFQNGIYYRNWYLPARDEFNMYTNVNFQGAVWTSTEATSTQAWIYQPQTQTTALLSKIYPSSADVVCMKKC